MSTRSSQTHLPESYKWLHHQPGITIPWRTIFQEIRQEFQKEATQKASCLVCGLTKNLHASNDKAGSRRAKGGSREQYPRRSLRVLDMYPQINTELTQSIAGRIRNDFRTRFRTAQIINYDKGTARCGRGAAEVRQRCGKGNTLKYSQIGHT